LQMKSSEENKLMVADEVVRGEHDLKSFLELLNQKEETVNFIHDATDRSKDIIQIIKTTSFPIFKDTLQKSSEKPDQDMFSSLELDLYFLTWFFLRTEIEEGLMFCEKCKRWYPIDETIPQMLPDGLRDQAREQDFLKKWQKKIPEEILKKGNPFHL